MQASSSATLLTLLVCASVRVDLVEGFGETVHDSHLPVRGDMHPLTDEFLASTHQVGMRE
jgi:hypothetical protein